MEGEIVVICCSGSFYEHANQLADELEKLGYKAVVPATAEAMRKSGNYDIDAIKTWYKNPADAHIKAGKMNGHIEKVAAGDAVLILNDDKPGKSRYVGPNTLMEWGVAVHLKKPIFIYNDVPRDSNYYEEALTVNGILNGDLAKIEL